MDRAAGKAVTAEIFQRLFSQTDRRCVETIYYIELITADM